MKLFYSILFVLGFASLAQAQVQVPDDCEGKTIKEDLAELKETIEAFDINQLFDQLDGIITDARPSDEEMDNIKQELTDAVDRISEIDFTEIQESIDELIKQFEGVFDGIEFDRSIPTQEKKSEDTKIKRI